MITSRILPDRLAQMETIHLQSGSHERFEKGACAMELVSWLVDEPWTDQPKCACPVLGAFVRSWNDALSDSDRDRLLKPLVPKLVGTKASVEIETRRSYMTIDWLIRTYTPMWLDLVPALATDAAALRDLAELKDFDTVKSSGLVTTAARRNAAAASDAASAAASDAASAAARNHLTPIVDRLQQSAVGLLEAMIAEQ